MSDKTVVLPVHEEMLKRLIAVRDEPHYQEGLYPLLLKNAGQRRVASGVVMMFTLAIHDYSQGLPPIIKNLLFMDIPDFIDALIDDKEVAQEAKAFLEKAFKS